MESEQKHVEAYQTMMARVSKSLEASAGRTLKNLHAYIENAQEKAVELEELSREEALRIGQYLRRDLEDIARFNLRTQSSLLNWMNFDLNLLENHFLNMCKVMIDQTQESLKLFSAQASSAENAFWHTGEVAGPGTLECTECGKQMHYHKPGRIPPCPSCHKTEFKRVWGS